MKTKKLVYSKIIYMFFILSLMLLSTANIKAEEDTITLNRIYTYMPEVVVEISGQYSGDVIAKLGNETLAVNSVNKFDNKNNTERIFVILDTSKENSDFIEMKKALTNLVDSVNDNTKIVIYTYGESVNKISSGGETKKEIKKKINKLKNNQSGNKIYDAIGQIYQTYFREECNFDRQYMLLLTSLPKQDVGAATSKEAANIVLDKSIPVYAFVPKSTSEDRINSLSSFARSTGGNIYVYKSSKTKDGLKDFKKQIDNVSIIKLSAKSNVANNKKKLFTISIEGKYAAENVRIMNSKADTVAPEIIKVTGDKVQNSIVISFSENVKGAENLFNYTVKDKDDREMKLSSAEYNSSELNAYIYVDSTLYNGEYTIEVKGIYDASQNKNPLIYENEVTLDNLTNEKTFIQKHLWIIIVSLAAILLLITITVLVIKSKKNKKNNSIKNSEKIDEISRKIDKNQQDIVKEVGNLYKHTSVPNEKNVRIITGTGGRKVTFRINMKNRVEQRVEMEMHSSIIVGRSAECELSVDDTNMSRQHFAIEDCDGQCVISDLHSSNGTYVNGIKLNGRQIIRNNDKITAGATEFMLYM